MQDPIQQIVATGYDAIADRYLAARDPQDPLCDALLGRAIADLQAGDPVLDLGCGAGVPVTRWLSRRFRVIGVDISTRQIALARQLVPAATFIQADILAYDPLAPDLPAPASYAAISAWYAIIHVPRREQLALIQRIYHWLRPNGIFLASWAIDEWEGVEADWQGWGAAMGWSHFAVATSREMLIDAGFAIEWEEMLTNADGERWVWIIARRGVMGAGLA